MSEIFISYNRDSESIAKTLVNDCEALGHSLWFDKELSGGQAWWEQILEKIRKCDVFIFVLNPQALESAACKSEYRYAADLCKPILPVLVSDDVKINLLPSALSRIQFVDYRKRDRKAAFRLARALGALPKTGALPNPLPQQPEVPVSYLGSLNEKIGSSSHLSYEMQSALLIDLKRELLDKASTGDARTLLVRLRDRRDIYAAIAEEIDELLKGGDEKKYAGKKTQAHSTDELKVKKRPGGAKNALTKGIEWKRSAVFGGITGLIYGVVVILIWEIVDTTYFFPESLIISIVPGLGGAVSGVIIGNNAKILIGSAFCALLAWQLSVILSKGPLLDAIFGGGVLFAPVGAIVGAVVARAFYKK